MADPGRCTVCDVGEMPMENDGTVTTNVAVVVCFRLLVSVPEIVKV